MPELTSQPPRPSDKTTPPRTGKHFVLSTSHTLAAFPTTTLFVIDTHAVARHQNPRWPSTSHRIKSRRRRPRAHPLTQMLPSHSHHHPDQRPTSRTLPSPTTSPVRTTTTAFSRSSQIRSTSRLGTRRRRPPATNPSSPPLHRSHRRLRYWAEERPPVATAGRIPSDPDRSVPPCSGAPLTRRIISIRRYGGVSRPQTSRRCGPG